MKKPDVKFSFFLSKIFFKITEQTWNLEIWAVICAGAGEHCSLASSLALQSSETKSKSLRLSPQDTVLHVDLFIVNHRLDFTPTSGKINPRPHVPSEKPRSETLKKFSDQRHRTTVQSLQDENQKKHSIA